MIDRKDRKELRELLKPENNGLVEESKNSLTAFWRTILADLRIDMFKWSGKMESYLNNPRNGVRQDPKSRSSARGNLNKELLKTWISWKVFEKGIRFLKPMSAEISVKFIWAPDAEHPAMHESVHMFTMNLAEQLDETDLDECPQLELGFEQGEE